MTKQTEQAAADPEQLVAEHEAAKKRVRDARAALPRWPDGVGGDDDSATLVLILLELRLLRGDATAAGAIMDITTRLHARPKIGELQAAAISLYRRALAAGGKPKLD
jgi:hypothetical protein